MTENELDIFLNRNKEQIIIIIDDFHKLRNNRKILDKIKIFNKIFIIVDTLYTLDYELRDIEADIGKYAIKELSPLKRNELIEKWLMINFDGYSLTESEKLKIIDKKTAQIEAITYKSLNGGIMPAYPFLILSILSNVETLNKPLSKEITSYGYCYEALIIISLIKCGLEQDDEIGGFTH